MRIRRALWRTAAPRVGAALPSLTRRYYDGVVASLVGSLMRVPGVLAVYAYGSYTRADLRLGRSDVDLLAVVDDTPPEREAALILDLRKRFRRRQSVFPLALSVLTRSEFARGAAWHAFVRRRIYDDSFLSPVSEWRLLGGTDVRASPPWEPDPRLAYLTEACVRDALDAVVAGGGRRVTVALRPLREELEREAPDTRFAHALADASRRPAAAIAAALEVIDEHRARHELPRDKAPPDTGAWRTLAPDDAAVVSARRLVTGRDVRSAALSLPPFEDRPRLLLECGDLAEARPVLEWALTTGAAQARHKGLRLEILTSCLVEDTWRSSFRWITRAAGSIHLAGEPLAPRLRRPASPFAADLLEYHAFRALAEVRHAVLGLRTQARERTLLLRLALAARLLRGEPPTTYPEELLPRAGRLGLGEYARFGALLWHGRHVVGQQDAVHSQPRPVD